MSETGIRINWAPRVSREKILELYIKVASGNDDEELINEIADSFYARCSDIIRIYEKRFACPACREELPHPHQPGTELLCGSCGWRTGWKTFYGTIKGKQLSVNADLTDITKRFVRELPECSTPQAKMILIDAIMHACHAWVRDGTTYYGRPLAVNFIDGTMNQVVYFLENLPDGPESLPEMTRQLMDWRKKVLSLFSDSDIEMDRVRYLVESMPRELRTEITELLKDDRRQKAVERLRQVEEYTEKLEIHRGDIASQAVRMIDKQLKGKLPPNRQQD